MAAEIEQDAEVLAYCNEFDNKLKLSQYRGGKIGLEFTLGLKMSTLHLDIFSPVPILTACGICTCGLSTDDSNENKGSDSFHLELPFPKLSKDGALIANIFVCIGQRTFDFEVDFEVESLEEEEVSWRESVFLIPEPLDWKRASHASSRLESLFGYDGKIANIILEFCPLVGLGDIVTLSKNRMGRVAYIGSLEGKEGIYYGIDLMVGTGKHNGTRNNKTYFVASGADRGAFVRRKAIECLGVGKLGDVGNPRMEGVSLAGMHGVLFEDDWLPPIRVVECEKQNRPGYESMPSHEYEEDPQTMIKKVQKLAQLIRESKLMIAYTGAGISTSAGINDYACKQIGKASSIHKNRKKPKKMRDAEPTLGHRVLTQLYFEGYMKNWVQQNHDGLPQAAGFPQHEINEIHGAWWDISNPVVAMSGTLRSDLWDWMEEWQEKADLTLCMGTSLVGMSADDCVSDVAERFVNEGEGLGSVIVGLQRTRYDDISSIRFYCKIDELVALLARELDMIIPPYKKYKPNVDPKCVVEEGVYKIPYDSDGNLTKDPSKMIIWDLRLQNTIIVNNGSGKGFKGKIFSNYEDTDHLVIMAPRMRPGHRDHGVKKRKHYLGSWWIETITQGKWHTLPFLNEKVILQSDAANYFKDYSTVD